ncbi:MAG: helix-turn-helix transcriptional regulator [Acidobacteria bacterium]|nr:helix-turn-helix transcriptional regulator [Acidobacteriota bacterium]MBI3489014.1 helix-turn-helix transcriptional regulator [Acidobacteriota bacterium]
MTLGGALKVEQRSEGQTREMVLHPGCIQVMPEGDARLFRHAEVADHLHLHLPNRLTARIAAGMGRRSGGLVPEWQADDPAVHQLALSLWEESHAGGPRGPLFSDGLSTALTAHLLARYGAAGPGAEAPPRLSKGMLKRVLEFMDSHLSSDPSLEDLAAVAELSPSHFSTLFRQATGVSPYQFLTRRRVERAQELLSATNTPIAAIAVQVGFYDQSHLTRHMRRLTGLTPRALRKADRGMS